MPTSQQHHLVSNQSTIMMDIEMSPIFPPLGHEEGYTPRFSGVHAELDLCSLLQSMTLSKGKSKLLVQAIIPCAAHSLQSTNEHDTTTEDLAYHSDVSESSKSKCNSYDLRAIELKPTSSEAIQHPSLPACHFLQSILASLDPDSPALNPSPYPYPVASGLQTTNGAYLDTILTHRSLLSAFPPAHRGCALALLEIAKALESRPWQADRDSDAEAVAALRHEGFATESYLT